MAHILEALLALFQQIKAAEHHTDRPILQA
jgi:hypothetical protein